MFGAITIYKIVSGELFNAEAMSEALEKRAFAPCSASQEKAVGWVAPRGESHGAMVESINGHRIAKFCIQTKTVPASAINKHVKAAKDHIEETTGRKPGKKGTKELKEDAVAALLPQAFPRDKHAWVWFDVARGRIIISSASQGDGDEIVTALVRAFDGLAISYLQTQITPRAVMASWLADGDKLDDEDRLNFCIERETELKSEDEEKAVVKFKNHSLNNDEVRKHLSEGKYPVNLGLSWKGRVALVLDEAMHLKKIKYLEGVFDGRNEDQEQGFDADVAIATGELQPLIDDLVNALGGEPDVTP